MPGKKFKTVKKKSSQYDLKHVKKQLKKWDRNSNVGCSGSSIPFHEKANLEQALANSCPTGRYQVRWGHNRIGGYHAQCKLVLRRLNNSVVFHVTLGLPFTQNMKTSDYVVVSSRN